MAAQQKAQAAISEKVRKAFNDMDKNKDGVVTFREFRDYCSRTIGLEGVAQAFCEIDQSDDQQITLEELNYLCTQKVRPEKIQECHITNLFHELDKSGDGKLDKAEFRRLMCQCGHGEDAITNVFNYVAGDDGQITLEEFLEAFKRS